MSAQVTCPDPRCGRSRLASLADAPGFHRPGCKVRRRLEAENRAAISAGKKAQHTAPAIKIGDATCFVGSDGLIYAARSFDGLRWEAWAR